MRNLKLFSGFFLLFFSNLWSLTSIERNETFFDRLMKSQAGEELFKGASLMEKGFYRQAAVEFAKSCDKNPVSPAYAMYGAALYWLGDIEGAIYQFDMALKKDPQNAAAYQLKGIALARKGDSDGALENFLKSLELDPKRGDINMNIGSVYFSRGLMSSALSYMKNAVKIEPSNPLYLYQIGLIYFYLERYDDAADFFKLSYSRSIDYHEPVLWLGLSLERMGKYPEALKNYLKAVSMSPGDFFARYKAASLLLKTGNRKEALSQIKKSLLIRPYEKEDGISLFVSYGGGSPSGSEGENEPVKKFSNSTLEQIYRNIIKIPPSEKLYFTIDVISSPQTILQKKSQETLKKGVDKDLKRRYWGKSASLEPSSPSEREKAVYEALSSLEKDSLLSDPKYDHKINFYMSSQPAAKKENAKAVYSPREIKNTMGLWVYGNNWLDALNEERENNQACSSGDICPLINGLSSLLAGQAGEADDFFLMAEKTYPLESFLGRAASLVARGNEKKAVEILRQAARTFPKENLIKQNLRWLENGK